MVLGRLLFIFGLVLVPLASFKSGFTLLLSLAERTKAPKVLEEFMLPQGCEAKALKE